MNRKFLEELGLEKELIDKVMAEYGKAIQEVKPADDYEELKTEKAALEKQVQDLEGTITATTEKYADVDQTIEEKERLIKDYKIKNLKIQIANKAGIPIHHADRLHGENEEELKADAELMATDFSTKVTSPLKSTEPDDIDPAEQAYGNMIQNLQKGE